MKHLNKKSKLVLVAVALIVIVGGTFIALRDETSNPNIVLQSPLPNTVVRSPLSISGMARGMWYFEGSFPVTLLDSNGNVLVNTYASAKADWMTEDFVPFQSTFTFGVVPTDTGTIILKKDNPSGLPENDASVSIPVRFR